MRNGAIGYIPAIFAHPAHGFPAGWFLSAGANLSDIFAVVGDISGNYKSETVTAGSATATASLNVHTFLAGQLERRAA